MSFFVLLFFYGFDSFLLLVIFIILLLVIFYFFLKWVRFLSSMSSSASSFLLRVDFYFHSKTDFLLSSPMGKWVLLITSLCTKETNVFLKWVRLISSTGSFSFCYRFDLFSSMNSSFQIQVTINLDFFLTNSNVYYRYKKVSLTRLSTLFPSNNPQKNASSRRLIRNNFCLGSVA